MENQQEKITFSSLTNFSPKQKEAELALDNYKYLLYGGALGGGKSYWLRWVMLKMLIRYYQQTGKKGIQVGLFCEDYPTLQDRQLSKLKFEFPEWLGTYSDKTHNYTVKSEYGGGVIAFRNLDEISKYKSAEFAMIGVDELTQNPEEIFTFLRTRLRWPGIANTKFVAATNPDGIGYLWVKTKWIDRIFPPNESEAELFHFVKALPTDNPFLDETYIKSLESLPEKKRNALLYGDWDSMEGQFFEEWSSRKHVVRAFDIPSSWRKFRSIDVSGRNGYTACTWFALDYDGNVWCVAPDTKILTEDLRWVDAGSLEEGDRLLGFDENTPDNKKRQWKESIVESVEKIMQPSYKLTLSDGTEVVCSENHKWLLETSGRRRQWKSTKDIRLGWKLLKVSDVWETDNSWGAGYLAGAFDGEGCLSNNQRGTMCSSIAQKDNALFNRVKIELDKRNIRYGVYPSKKNNVYSLAITRKRDIMKLLGSVRPERLLPKFNVNLMGGFNAYEYPYVVKKEFVGLKEVMAIKTTSSTYIANGLASHNCYREYYRKGMDADEHARNIANLSKDEYYQYTVIDNSAFSKIGLPETLAEVYVKNGIDNLVPSSKERIQGWDFVHQYLRWDDFTEPKLRFFDNCKDTIRTLPSLIYDKNNSGDMDTDGEDHIADTIRYFIQTVRGGRTQKPMTAAQKRLKELYN